MITPESLEGMFVLQGSYVHIEYFRNLRYVVVEQLASFIATERGRQLQSLLARLESAIHRTVPRIGLSATLGDMGLAAEFLRPGGASAVQEMVSKAQGQEIMLIVRGYEEAGAPSTSEGMGKENDAAGVDSATLAIGGEHLQATPGKEQSRLRQ